MASRSSSERFQSLALRAAARSSTMAWMSAGSASSLFCTRPSTSVRALKELRAASTAALLLAEVRETFASFTSSKMAPMASAVFRSSSMASSNRFS